jgi:hypothetical protein
MNQALVLPGEGVFRTSAAISTEGAVDLLLFKRGGLIQQFHIEPEAMAALCDAWLQGAPVFDVDAPVPYAIVQAGA